MNNIQKLNKKTGLLLDKNATYFFRNSVSLTPIKTRSHKVEQFLNAEYGVSSKKITLSDGDYRLIPFNQWEDIISIMEKRYEKYIKNIMDCDNHAYWFSAEVPRIWRINSGGVIHGHCYDLEGNWKYGHFWNGLIIPTTRGWKLYFYDLIKKGWTLYTGKSIIKDTEYRALTFRFF